MALPPAWKVRRELARIGDKLSLAAHRWLYDPLRKPVYDLTWRWRQTITTGSLPLTDRVAVFVVYQPKGVPPSIFLTLEHLWQNRFAPLVVSNGPLRPEDRRLLASKAALVIERPNVGYDFGAYRDGIRHLWSLKHDLSLLVLMNDSTWFPLRRDDDSLARMEALEADLAGHVFKTEDEKKSENDHVESHLLMISRAFLQSGDFHRFWSGFRMSDNRPTTITLGEKAFTQLAIRSRRSIRTLLGRERLMSILDELDDDQLEAVLKHTIDSFSRRQADLSKVRRLFAAGEPWRDEYLQWSDTSLRNSRSFLLSAAFIMPALVYGRMGFAKKANDIRFHMAREELLDLEASGLIPPVADEVRLEIAEAVRKWVPPQGEESTMRPRMAAKAQVG